MRYYLLHTKLEEQKEIRKKTESSSKYRGFPGGTSGKKYTYQCRRHKRCGFDPWVGKIPWGKVCQPTPVFLPGEAHGQRSLVGYSPWGHRVRHD